MMRLADWKTNKFCNTIKSRWNHSQTIDVEFRKVQNIPKLSYIVFNITITTMLIHFKLQEMKFFYILR